MIPSSATAVSSAADVQRVTFVAKVAEVAIRADQGSRRVSISVSGREVLMNAEAAVEVARKLSEAARRST